MSEITCHCCGRLLNAGSPKYEIEVRVRSSFDGVILGIDEEISERELERIYDALVGCSEEEGQRQVYENDVFVMCPGCKEVFLTEIYSRLRPDVSPAAGRDHLIN